MSERMSVISRVVTLSDDALVEVVAQSSARYQCEQSNDHSATHLLGMRKVGTQRLVDLVQVVNCTLEDGVVNVRSDPLLGDSIYV